jgi:hypothetical protein
VGNPRYRNGFQPSSTFPLYQNLHEPIWLKIQAILAKIYTQLQRVNFPKIMNMSDVFVTQK